MGGEPIAVGQLVALVDTLSESDRLQVLRTLLASYADGIGDSPSVDVYPSGYVVFASDDNTQSCNSWLLAPGTNLSNRGFLGFIYFVALVYVFLGIAIISDIFMAAIEVITAAEGTRRYRGLGGSMIEYRYKIMNPTIANLTLMALGSSAPEILLSIIGAIATLDEKPDVLGPSTIVGSAAYNLLIISPICISALPNGEKKRIKDLGVFMVTAAFSLVAYLWLYVALQVTTPDVVELWEAFTTMGLFAALLVVAYLTDVRCRCCRPPAHVEADGADERSTTSKDGDGELRHSTRRVSTTLELMGELHRTRELDEAGHMPANQGLVEVHPLTAYTPMHTGYMRGLTGQRRLQEHTPQPTEANPLDSSAALSKVSSSNSFKRGLVLSASARMLLGAKGAAQPALEGTQGQLTELAATATSARESANNTDGGLPEHTGSAAPAETAPVVGFHCAQYAVGAGWGEAVTVLSLEPPCEHRVIVRWRVQIEADDDGEDEEAAVIVSSESLLSDSSPVFNPTTCSDPNMLAQPSSEEILLPSTTARCDSGHAPARGSSAQLCAQEKGEAIFEAGERTTLVAVPIRAAAVPVSGSAAFALQLVSARSVTPNAVRAASKPDKPDKFDRSADTGPGGAAGTRVAIGPNRRAMITVLGAEAAKQPAHGALQFAEAALVCEEACGKVTLKIERVGGLDGTVSARYETADVTANAGEDYVAASGIVSLPPGVASAEVGIVILDDDIEEDTETFTCSLSALPPAELAAGARGGAAVSTLADSTVTEPGALAAAGPQASALVAGGRLVCTITILDDDSWRERLRRSKAQLRNALAATFYATDSWSGKFREALMLSGGVDEETGEELPPSMGDAAMHAISLFWKLQFALVPPESWGSGWPAFFVSLVFVGIWTAVVGEIATVFGCVIGLGDAITAITFVAIGTSLPDTFASRLATLHDEYADAAIGNITGSNSVNVFLGLGIPWIIGAFYHKYAPSGKGQYDVPAGSLAFSVVLFSVLATVAISALLLRRATNGAELGGSRASARLLSLGFFALWLLYIVLASLNAKGAISIPGL